MSMKKQLELKKRHHYILADERSLAFLRVDVGSDSILDTAMLVGKKQCTLRALNRVGTRVLHDLSSPRQSSRQDLVLRNDFVDAARPREIDDEPHLVSNHSQAKPDSCLGSGNRPSSEEQFARKLGAVDVSHLPA